MRVLMLNYEYPPLGGGAANATEKILRVFAEESDIEVDLVTSSMGASSVHSVTPRQRIHYLDIGKAGSVHYQTNRDLLSYSWRAYRYARRLLRTQDFDVCHAFFGIPCGVLAWRLGLPYIVSLRGSDVPFYNERFRVPDTLVFQRLSRHVWSRSGAVIANSIGLRDLARASAPNQDIGVIPNGVDTARFSPGPSVEGPLRVLIVARLITRKGIPSLIEAVKHLEEEDIQLTIAGDGNQREALGALVQQLGLEDRVTFLGVVAHEELPAIYQAHHIFVLPSLNEGMSNTVLEAMASGLPILMTDTGGARETVEPGRNGYLLEFGSMDSIVDGLRQYLERPERIQVHGARSREMAENMSWQAVATAYRGCYEQVTAEC